MRIREHQGHWLPGLIAGAVVLTLLLLTSYLLNRPTVQSDGTISLDGSGYAGIAERDGQLFCVDTSGCVYALDWYSSQKNACVKIPAEDRWITDEAFCNAYYMQGTTLMRYDLLAAEESALCQLPDCERPIAATDHAFLYHKAGDDNSLVLLNLDTLQAVSAQDAPEVPKLLIDSDVAYYILTHEGSLERDNYTDIMAWDLQTGETTVLAHYDRARYLPDDSSTFVYQVLWDSLSVVGSNVYYYALDDHDLPALCCVPKDGNAAPEVIHVSQASEASRVKNCGFLCVSDGSTTTLYTSEGSTCELLPLMTIDSQIDQVTLIRSGERYALFYWDVTGNQNRLVLGTTAKK